MDITQYTDKGLITRIEATEKFAAIEELAQVFRNTDICDDVDALVTALKEREEIMSTGIGFTIAVPHARIREVKRIAFALGTSNQGIAFDSIDEKPVHLIILVAAGEMQHIEYLRLLSRIMNLLKKERTKEAVINSNSAEEILNLLKPDLTSDTYA
jgi:nitrogen PTS system EIIA component